MKKMTKLHRFSSSFLKNSLDSTLKLQQMGEINQGSIPQGSIPLDFSQI